MADESNTIRFKRGDVEFELTSSKEEVAKAWTALQDSVVSSFKSEGPTRPKTTDSGGAGGGTKKAPRKRTRLSTGAGGGRGEQSEARKTLMDAKLDTLPDIGRNPPALIVGYAILNWARKELDIDELSASDIHAVAHDRLRIPHTAGAYREAFRTHPKAVHRTSKSPQTYQLMNPGGEALNSYLKKVEAGATPDDAAAATEEEAEQS